MDITPVRTKRRRPSKGVATHNRRLKQEARRTSIPGIELKKRKPLAHAVKK